MESLDIQERERRLRLCWTHFAVRLGFELTLQGILFNEFPVIFDDTVMYQCDIAESVRMGVLVAHASLRQHRTQPK